MSLSVLSDLRDLKRAFADLFAPSPEDEEASYQLAVSARRFSRRTKAVVDDKLNFSATLMRAGEVDAANRLLQEFERDVRDEEAALMECVNEVKAAGAVRKRFEVRKRAATLAALGLIGTSVLGMSAAGMAAVGMFKERAEAHHRSARSDTVAGRAAAARRTAAHARSSKVVRKVKIAGVNVTLRGSQVAAYEALTTGTVQRSEIQRLLVLLPDAVAAKVQQAIGAVTAAVPSPSAPAALPVKVKKVKKETMHPKHDAEPSPSESQSAPDSEQSNTDDSHKTHHSSGHSSGGGDGQGDNMPIIPPISGGSDTN